MLSIIICSKYKQLSSALIANINETVGVIHEIIAIDNSNADYSIFSAYNKGYSLSQYPYLCFVHEDVMFKTFDWGNKLISHLKEENVGIIGVAGGCLASRIPSSWSSYQVKMNLIQAGNEPVEHISKPNNYQFNRAEVVLLDGVFLATQRALFQLIKFDENFKGFHGYDYDICLQAKSHNLSNYVIYDLLIEHYSHGYHNTDYYKNLIKVFKKWQGILPCTSANIDIKKIQEIEKKQVSKLIRKLGIRNFSNFEVKEIVSYFANIVNHKNVLQFFFIKLFFARLFNSPKRLFQK